MYHKSEISKNDPYHRLTEKPIVFKEQLKLTEESNSHNLLCSLQDYKIDYNDYLGSGLFGSVYGIVKRPDNDKNFFSYWFPSTYDYFFRSTSVTKQTTPWCVKISNSLLSILYHSHENLFLAQVIGSFSEKQEQLSSNELQKKYRITQMELPITDSFKAQIKTRIQGNTLKYYLENDLFIKSNQYHLRKAYMDFLWNIKNVPLRFEDLHSENIMYDEQHKRFEIIDSPTFIAKNQNRDRTPFLNFVDYKTQKILDKLEQLVKNNTHYTQKLDAHLIKELNKRPSPKEIHTSPIRSNLSFFAAKFIFENWKGRILLNFDDENNRTKKANIDIADDIITRHNQIDY